MFLSKDISHIGDIMRTLNISVTRYGSAFVLGALLYALIELLWRGHTHWSMMLCGGVCLAAIYFVYLHCSSAGVLGRALIGCAIITLSEFITGLFVNIMMSWNVWDYSKLPFNFMGQICVSYTALWFALCFPAFYICKVMEDKIFSHLADKNDVGNDKQTTIL